jgi:iron complex transport system ATP-binding protein
VSDTLSSLGIAHLAERSCARLSGGELQMVLIARAIASEPELIVLDEPESNLDFKNQLIVLKTLHALTERGIACIFNTHYPVHALRHADKALLLDKKGGVCFGDSHAVITEANMRAAFGVHTVIGQLETPHNEYFDVLAVDTLSEETTPESEESLMSQPAAADNTRLAILGIIIENRDSAEKINAMLHEYARYIVGRMGMPYPQKGVSIISIIIDAPETAISNLSGKLGQLPGVSAKVTYSKK